MEESTFTFTGKEGESECYDEGESGFYNAPTSENSSLNFKQSYNFLYHFFLQFFLNYLYWLIHVEVAHNILEARAHQYYVVSTRNVLNISTCAKVGASQTHLDAIWRTLTPGQAHSTKWSSNGIPTFPFSTQATHFYAQGNAAGSLKLVLASYAYLGIYKWGGADICFIWKIKSNEKHISFYLAFLNV